ncbi:hypothetical protein ACFS4T_04835 [Pseudomonas lini]
MGQTVVDDTSLATGSVRELQVTQQAFFRLLVSIHEVVEAIEQIQGFERQPQLSIRCVQPVGSVQERAQGLVAQLQPNCGFGVTQKRVQFVRKFVWVFNVQGFGENFMDRGSRPYHYILCTIHGQQKGFLQKRFDQVLLTIMGEQQKVFLSFFVCSRS